MKKSLYLISPKISFEKFKLIQANLSMDIKPVNLDKILWQLLKDEKIVMWVSNDTENDIGIALTLPERYKNYLLKEIL
jgi:hypothetical protein